MNFPITLSASKNELSNKIKYLQLVKEIQFYIFNKYSLIFLK